MENNGPKLLMVTIYLISIMHVSAYFHGPDRLKWPDAKAYCASQGTTLASILNAADFQELQDHIVTEPANFGQRWGWIGLRWNKSSNITIWTNDDGTPIQQTYGFSSCDSNGIPLIGQDPWVRWLDTHDTLHIEPGLFYKRNFTKTILGYPRIDPRITFTSGCVIIVGDMINVNQPPFRLRDIHCDYGDFGYRPICNDLPTSQPTMEPTTEPTIEPTTSISPSTIVSITNSPNTVISTTSLQTESSTTSDNLFESTFDECDFDLDAYLEQCDFETTDNEMFYALNNKEGSDGEDVMISEETSQNIVCANDFMMIILVSLLVLLILSIILNAYQWKLSLRREESEIITKDSFVGDDMEMINKSEMNFVENDSDIDTQN